MVSISDARCEWMSGVVLNAFKHLWASRGKERCMQKWIAAWTGETKVQDLRIFINFFFLFFSRQSRESSSALSDLMDDRELRALGPTILRLLDNEADD